jgi:hypothetical protein
VVLCAQSAVPTQGSQRALRREERRRLLSSHHRFVTILLARPTPVHTLSNPLIPSS